MVRQGGLSNLSPSQLNSRQGDRGPKAEVKRSRNGTSAKGQENTPAAPPERRSSVTYGKHIIKQDPRPVNDKAYITQSVNNIITYLAGETYPSVLSPKLLMAPTTKDFTVLIQFLILRYDQHRATFGKLEEDVPLFFKQCGYPFPVNRSGLYAVGTTQTWPALLAGVVWLVELLNYDTKAQEGLQQTFDCSGVSEKSFFEYVVKSYRYFMQGEDDKGQKFDEQLKLQYVEKQQAVQAEFYQIEQANQSLAAANHALRTEPSPLVLEDQRRAEAAADTTKFENVLAKLQANIAALKKKAADQQAEVNANSDQIAAITQENAELAQRVKQQGVNINDYRAQLSARDMKRQTVSTLADKLQKTYDKLHDSQLQSVAAMSSLSDAAKTYNDRAYGLKLVGPRAKYADGMDLEMRVNPSGTTSEQLLSIDVKTELPAAIQRAKQHYRTKARKLQDEQSRMKDGTQPDATADMQQQVNAAAAAVSEATAAYAQRKELLDAELRQLETRAQKVQVDIQTDVHERLEAARATELQLKGSIPDLESEYSKEQEAAHAQLRAEVQALAAFRANAGQWSRTMLEASHTSLEKARGLINDPVKIPHLVP